MASFVYFKFKSQKDPTRISFDGPFIQVWDLKREIISISKLGDGSDFDLRIYNEANEGEYLFPTTSKLILMSLQNTPTTPTSYTKTLLSSPVAFLQPYPGKAELLDMSPASPQLTPEHKPLPRRNLLVRLST